MIVLVLERVPESLRGELTRWLLEVRAGVFVGRVSAMVRERLWEHVLRSARRGASGVLVRASDTEQGFSFEVLGDRAYEVVDFEGLQLVRRV